MILSQVNRARSLWTVVLFTVACAPAGTNSRGTESATATAAAPATMSARAATVPAAQDSNITRADLARTDGSATAPVWVIIASDFQCPYCKEWHDATYPALHNEFVKTGKVRVAYVNFPLAIHAQAWTSAEAAMCAGAQGKFWEMHDAIFDNQKRWASGPSPAAVFDSLARTTGVDMGRWRDCIRNGVTKPLIQADHARAAGAGIRSTPSILIGNDLLAGAHPIESLRGVIDSALVKSRGRD
jgi:protein-disulfide isomerase